MIIRKSIFHSSGQIVLLLVLITVIGLTIGLSLISRTITDVRISSQIEQSGRAFSAAESGIETALNSVNVGIVNPTGTVNIVQNGSSAKFTVNSLGGSADSYIFPLTEANDVQTVWFINHKTDRTLDIPSSRLDPDPASASFDICWGSIPNYIPAVNLSLIYKTGDIYGISKLTYDSDSDRRAINNFLTPDLSGNNYCDTNLTQKKSLVPITDFQLGTVSNPILIALRIQPIYNNSVLAVKPQDGFSFPIQGEIINSIGKTNTGIARKIQVINTYKVLPALLDYTLFIENDIEI